MGRLISPLKKRPLGPIESVIASIIPGGTAVRSMMGEKVGRGETALEFLDFIPGAGAIAGVLGSAGKKVIKGIKLKKKMGVPKKTWESLSEESMDIEMKLSNERIKVKYYGQEPSYAFGNREIPDIRLLPSFERQLGPEVTSLIKQHHKIRNEMINLSKTAPPSTPGTIRSKGSPNVRKVK